MKTPIIALLWKLLRDETAATAIEYGFIAAFVALAAVSVMGNRHAPQHYI